MFAFLCHLKQELAFSEEERTRNKKVVKFSTSNFLFFNCIQEIVWRHGKKKSTGAVVIHERG